MKAQTVLTTLITGTSRGIGLGLVKEFLKHSEYRVIATCRSPSLAKDLRKLQKLHSKRLLIFPLDITLVESHETLKESLSDHQITSIDILIANAGILSSEESDTLPSTCSIDVLKEDFETNVIGSILTLQSYQDLVCNSKLKLFSALTSGLGSISNTEQHGGYYPAYSVSKTALNMFCCSFAGEQSKKETGSKMLLVDPVSSLFVLFLSLVLISLFFLSCFLGMD
jgi:NAD(P)-dependent dehydrogenase (short-subunit alcohol dehydrogenase family)